MDTGSEARRSWCIGVPNEEERDEYLDRKIPGPDVEVVKLETLVMPLDTRGPDVEVVKLETLVMPLDTLVMPLDTRVMPLDSRVMPLDVRDIPCDDEELA